MPSISTRSRSFRRSSTVLAVALALAVGCGGGGGGTEALTDVDASVPPDALVVVTGPTLLETIPEDGAVGIATDTAFVFRFSQAMDTAATVAAYQSDELPADAVTFQWNDAADTLTVVPNDPLPYAQGDASVSALGFVMHIGTGATSAVGEPLATEATLSFTTLRRIVVTAEPVAALTGRVTSVGTASTALLGVGDSPAGVAASTFATFSLAAVPVGTTIEYARLRVGEGSISGTPDDDLGALSAEHVVFDTLDLSAYTAALIASVPNAVAVARSKGAPYLRSALITAFVQDDLDNREALNDRTQSRMRFEVATDADGNLDYITLSPGSASLEIWYLAE